MTAGEMKNRLHAGEAGERRRACNKLASLCALRTIADTHQVENVLGRGDDLFAQALNVHPPLWIQMRADFVRRWYANVVVCVGSRTYASRIP